jgi:hypothetical protein
MDGSRRISGYFLCWTPSLVDWLSVHRSNVAILQNLRLRTIPNKNKNVFVKQLRHKYTRLRFLSVTIFQKNIYPFTQLRPSG